MRSQNGHITEDLLVRYLLEECDAAERAQVEEWINADKANREEFYALKKAWDISGSGESLPAVDVDAAWKSVSKKTKGGGASPDKAQRKSGKLINFDSWTRSQLIWSAATIALMIMISISYLEPFFRSGTEIEFASTDSFESKRLPDNSLVVLSPNSSAHVHIVDDFRSVILEGKAYFEVQPDRESYFFVKTEKVTVTVLGTAFNVEETENGVRTEVREGKVRMEIGEEHIDLLAGDIGIYNEISGSLQNKKARSAQTWGDRTIVFNGTPLGEVVEHLQIFYSVQIVLVNEELANCRLTATFTDEQIGDVLRVIASTFDLQLKELKSDAFELDGEGC